jgi:glycine/D-amino acid oxidase-like deaminating enzyme
MANDVQHENVPVWADAGADTEHRHTSFPRLTRTIEADVCVIGLGGSGLACIGELLAAGVAASRIVGVDAGAVASGAAGRNGGFLLAGTADFYHDAIEQFGHARARRLYELTVEQIETIARETPSAVRQTGSLRIAWSTEERNDCERQLEALRADGFAAEAYAGPEGEGLLVPTDCAFDPLLRCRQLACRHSDAGVRFFEHSRVLDAREGVVVAAEGRVRADRVVIAVDGRLGRMVPELASRARPVRLQMLGTAPTREVTLPRPVYARWGYDYWQQLADGRLVVGGFRDAGGDAEWTEDATPSATIQRLLERFLRNELGVHAPVTHRWAATVSYSLNGLPLLQEVRPGVIATGAYSGTGNVMGALCGRGAARIALGERAEIAELVQI